jgi:hypothetical protein
MDASADIPGNKLTQIATWRNLNKTCICIFFTWCTSEILGQINKILTETMEIEIS